MNKKLLTLAVAAAMAAPAAAMADATLYGKIHLSIDYMDVEENASYGTPGKAGFNGWDVQSRASRLGVKGSEDLGNGLDAIYQIEMQIPISDDADSITDNDRGRIKMRNSFVGLKGNWGSFLVGRHDTPMKSSTGKLELFGDTMADYNATVGFIDLRADNSIAYISPSFSGFQFAGAMIPTGGATVEGVENLDADGIAEGYSLAGIYSNGPFYASLAYEAFDSDQWQPTGADFAEDYSQWRIGLGLLDWNGFTVTGIWESQSDLAGIDDLDRDLWQIQAGYAFGNNMVKAMYGSADIDGIDFDEDIGDIVDEAFDGDVTSWAIGFDHNFSKRTSAYLLYTELSDDSIDDLKDTDWSGFSLGMIHKF